MQDDLKRTTNDLLLQQEKLKKDVDTMGIKIDELKEQIDGVKKCDKSPHEIPYDLDMELNGFLKELKIQNRISEFKKEYRCFRLKGYVPFIAYLLLLYFNNYFIKFIPAKFDTFYAPNPFKVLVLAVVGYVVLVLWYRRL